LVIRDYSLEFTVCTGWTLTSNLKPGLVLYPMITGRMRNMALYMWEWRANWYRYQGHGFTNLSVCQAELFSH